MPENLCGHDYNIPLEYLRAYPFPAFVVKQTDAVTNGAAKPTTKLEYIWGNDKWAAIGGSDDLSGVLGRHAEFALQRWVEDGQKSVPTQQHETNLIHTITLPRSALSLKVAKTRIAHPNSSKHDEVWVITALDSVELPQKSSTRPPRTPPLHLAMTPGSFSPMADPNSQASNVPALTSNAILPELDCQLLLNDTDWSKTSLGPRQNWSSVIEMMIAVIMRSPTQDALWLGKDFNMIYNQHYAEIVHHPVMFGTSAKAKDAWGPVWDDVYPIIERCLAFGESCHFQDDLLLYRRGPTGHFVEKYHTWSFVPLFDADGTPLGLFNPTIETTASVLARRRQETLRDVSEQLSHARTSSDYYEGVCNVLEQNPKDVPFLAFYSVSSASSDGSTASLNLQASVGVPANHSACPSTMSLSLKTPRLNLPHLSSPTPSTASLSSGGSHRTRRSEDKSAWPLKSAMIGRQCVVMDDCASLIQGFPLRQWDVLPESAIVVPISTDRSASFPDAVMILGLNLQCPLDADYEEWIHVLRAHLTSALASVKSAESAHQRQVEQDRMAKAQTAWFQGAAHDLRSPLTLVAGPLDDVLRSKLTPLQRESLTLAQRNISRIQRLVNALLDFSKIEAGKLTGHFLAVDLTAFVTEIANLFAPALYRKHLRLHLDIQKGENTVWIDPTLMETVVTNLLSNAYKYTKKGSVTVTLKYENGNAEIAVTDTGCGIPSAELSNITDRFHRAATALSLGVEGTGIGLALTKELVKIHDGELLITSRTESEMVPSDKGIHGSTFTVRFPLVDRFDDTVQDIALSERTFGTYGRQLADEAMQSAQYQGTPGSDAADAFDRVEEFLFEKSDTILIVDDSEDIRTYLRRIFSPHCNVYEAKDGVEAFELARTMKPAPHLILCDFMMPRMNGSELLAAIRGHPMTKNIPMVLLSAATDEDLRLSALTNGAEDFILKPFKPKELLARIHLHMQLGKKRAHLERIYALREQEIKLLSDYCPSGIIRANNVGSLIYCNTAYKEHSGMSDDQDPNGWVDFVDAETRARLLDAWNEVLYGQRRETQLTWKWLNGRTESGTFIRLDLVGDTGMTGVLGCMQDISYQEEKLHEAEARRIEAEESKRQQELLVDMTSHEIRTPVSAILQCSSLVKENLINLKAHLLEAGSAGFVADEELLDELEKDVEALDSIYQCGLVQERIAGDVLSFARIQLDMLSLHFAPTNLKMVAQKVISAFAAEAKMKRITIDVEFGPSLDQLGVTHVKTDHVRLGQIVTNLVSNAIKFTANSTIRQIIVHYEVSLTPPDDGLCIQPPNGRGSAIGLSNQGAMSSRAAQDDEPIWLFVSITDTGPGLTPHESEILFQRFTQGNKMIHSQYGGSGLGLFICRKIAELLGGRIEVISELGKGSTFRFFIRTTNSALSQDGARKEITSPGEEAPSANTRALMAPHTTDQYKMSFGADASSHHVSPQASSAQSAAAMTSITTQQMRVLIVEDNIINQTVLHRQLKKTGWHSDVADNGLEALERLSLVAKEEVEGYDVVLMDLEMPIMDGLTAVQRIREMESEGRLKQQLVIALTGNAREAQIQQALDAGMDDVMIKPYRLPDLVEKLRKAAGTHSEQ